MKNFSYDWLIVGAGITGAIIAERLASVYNQKIWVIDRRNHVAGNAYDSINEHNILYHVYGPHIFHTNSARVIQYLSHFTEWKNYEHRVLGLVNGRFIPIPFNLTSIDILFSQKEAGDLKNLLLHTYGMNIKIPILKMLQSSDERIRYLADFIYQNVFIGYTTKQWGLKPEDLSPSVTERVPIHISYDDRYFQDKFQKMPKDGYTKLIEKILNHPNITLSLNTEYNDVRKSNSFKKIIFTGSIDEFFDYQLGELPYRSLLFEFQSFQQRIHQPTAQVNYPNNHQYTRITEMIHFNKVYHNKMTTIAIEYPQPYIIGKNIPYYPIPQEKNERMYQKYLGLISESSKNVFFAGRLGTYRYLNMDEAVDQALSLAEKIH